MRRAQRLLLACAVLVTAADTVPAARGQDYLAQAPARATPPRFTGTEILPPQIRELPDVQAELKVINRRSQLMVTRSNVVRTAIADPSILDIVQYSPNELAVIGASLGTTTVTFWFEDSPEPLIYLVEVIRDPSLEERTRHDYGRLEKKLAVLFPNSKVYLIPLSGKIVVKGQARDSEEAARILQIIRGEVINQSGSLAGPQPVPNVALNGLNQGFNPQDLASSYIVNMLDVPGEFQIMLRVRIAELNRSMLRRLGVDFEFLINDGRHFFSSVLAGSPATLTGIFEAGDVSVLINALESNGTAKLLAEPNITVLSGHPASFLSGGEFAVPTIVGVGGAQGTSTSFRGFGVSLVVTPEVIDRDMIRMQILPEFSAINTGNSVGGIPGVDTRRVSTTVELREGQTIALAGLLSHRSQTEITRVPLLGEIPIVGPLIFNGKRASEDETELLILVSPEIVRPMEADEVPPVPGYEVTHPNNWELYLNAQSEGAPDQRVHQLPPYGNNSGHGTEVGYSNFNPAPAAPGYGPQPTMPFGAPPAGPFGGGYGPPNTAAPPRGAYPPPGNGYYQRQSAPQYPNGTPAYPPQNGSSPPAALPYPTPVGPTAGAQGGRYGGYAPPASPAYMNGPNMGQAVRTSYETSEPPPQAPPPARKSWFGRS